MLAVIIVLSTLIHFSDVNRSYLKTPYPSLLYPLYIFQSHTCILDSSHSDFFGEHHLSSWSWPLKLEFLYPENALKIPY